MKPYELFLQLCVKAIGKRVYMPNDASYKTFPSYKAANNVATQYNFLLTELIVNIYNASYQQLNEDNIKAITGTAKAMLYELRYNW